MVRTQILFPQAMLGWIRKEAKKRGISVSEFLRRVIDKEKGSL
jgi:hypothetical protein